jgi:phospholipase C
MDVVQGRRSSRPIVAFIAIVLSITAPLAAFASTTPHRAQPESGQAGVPAFSHVFVVVMENLDYSSALATPELASIAAQYALATSYYGVSHPSLPNYLALTSGSTWGISSDCTDCYVSAPNLFSQFASAHLSFDAYMQGIPNSCYLDPYGGVDYAGKHDPFRYYDDVRKSPALCAHIEPYTELGPLLGGSGRTVPRFVWVTPNLCNDGHNCFATTAAIWLGSFVSSVTKSAAWRDGGVLFVTWDESDGDDSAVVPPGRIVSSGGGGHIMTLVIAPGVREGLRVDVPYNHYSLLATVEDAFALPLLGHASSATPMASFFKGSAKT